MIEQKKLKNIPIYKQVQDILLEKINNNDIKTSDKIPSEYELAREYNISRITANKAISELVAQGLLYREHGRGTFVSDNFRKKSQNIAIIFHDINNESNVYLSTIIKAINEKARANGYSIQIHTTNGNKLFSKENSAIEHIIKFKQIDGLLIITPLEKDDISELKKMDVPFVIVDSVFNIKDCEELNVNYVMMDDYDAAYTATNYLIEQGHKDIGIITGLFLDKNGKIIFIKTEFINGYKKALEGYGINPEPSYMKECKYREKDVYETTIGLLNLINRPTAILVEGDIVATAVVNAIKASGLRSPEDVVVFNYAISSDLTPFNVSKPIIKMAETATEMLLNLISKNPMETKFVKIPIELSVMEAVKRGN